MWWLISADLSFLEHLSQSSAGVSITSSVGISIKPKKSNSSFDSVELSVELSKKKLFTYYGK